MSGRLHIPTFFPPVETALREPNGLLAMGGDLSLARLLDAYRHGIFPWFNPGEPILWWSPDPRMVLVPGEVRVTRSLDKRIRNAGFELRVDTAFVDRLLSKCTDHLSLLAAPATLDKVYDFGSDAFDSIFDTLRTTMPCIVLDVPHQWSGWTKRALVSADDILIVAAPDLANLRNTKNIFDLLKASRPNDRTPLYCLNQVGVPKRPEINASEFAKAIESDPIAAIPFEPQMFGSAANNGQMIAEISANHRTTEMFLQIAQRLTGRGETKKPRGSFLSPLIEKLRAK